jgi:hypothetical protein
MAKAINYNRLFWIFHFIGWFIFSISDISRNFDELIKIPAFYYWLAAMFSGFFLTFLLRLMYRKIFQRNFNIVKKILIILISSFICSTAWLLSNWIINGTVELLKNELAAYVKLIYDYELVTYNVLRRIVDATYPVLAWSLLYFGLKTWYDFLSEKQGKEHAQLLAQQAQLQMLRYQINPHFLFNSLNSIQALIYKNQELADKVLTELSDFLRYSLSYEFRTIISFQEELEIVKKYLNIEKIRFGDKIKTDLQISEEAKSFPVISFILQPVVENAFKHGIKTSLIPLMFEINAVVNKNMLTLKISNSGSWIKNKTKGTGIENIKKRLKSAYGDKYKFEIQKNENSVMVNMDIPYLNK